MIGVILAAGMASRLRPLTDNCPKCLLSVGNRTLLGRTVDAMQQAGISKVVVVTGYRAEMITSFLEANYPEMEFVFLHNADYATTNNIYSLWMAMHEVKGKEFLLMDSDILCDPETVGRIARQEGSALALNRHELGDEEMKVVVDEQGRIKEISKTCRVEDARGESVGIEKISATYSEALSRELDTMILNENLANCFYELAFERLIAQGHTFQVVDTTDLFSYELDTPEDFRKATELLPASLR